MKNAFNLNSSLFQFMFTLKDFIILNFLWIVFSIPLITIGASTTALYTVTFKVTEDKDCYVARQFVKAFRDNFKQATIAEFVLLLPTLILSFGLFFWVSFQSVVGTIISTLCIIFLCILAGTIIFTFPLISRYENRVKQTLKNALFFCLTYKGYSVLFILFITIGVFLVTLSTPTAFLMCLFGFAFIAYVISYLMIRLFHKYDSGERDNISDSAIKRDEGTMDRVC